MTEQARANWIVTATVLIVALLVWVSLTREREVWINTVVDDNGEDPDPYPGKIFLINVGDTTYFSIMLRPGVEKTVIICPTADPSGIGRSFQR